MNVEEGKVAMSHPSPIPNMWERHKERSNAFPLANAKGLTTIKRLGSKWPGTLFQHPQSLPFLSRHAQM